MNLKLRIYTAKAIKLKKAKKLTMLRVVQDMSQLRHTQETEASKRKRMFNVQKQPRYKKNRRRSDRGKKIKR